MLCSEAFLSKRTLLREERSRGQSLKTSELFAFVVTLEKENATGSILIATTSLKYCKSNAAERDLLGNDLPQLLL